MAVALMGWTAIASAGKVITTESGLKIEDKKEGAGEPCKTGDVVQVHYTGWLKNGKEFDSSRKRGKPFAIELGAGSVIKGWEEGVPGMKVGGIRRLEIPPALAYGSKGAGKSIPPNAVLIFEIELVKIGGLPD
jgi:FKBP-type peptidyl-prolyl cis-trans isomerase